jgi:lipopolysaccharide/colanic/teichoic acid biosynthesis glycosyltransferase
MERTFYLIPGISFRKENIVRLNFKRIFDIVFSSCFLFVTLPLLLVIIVLIKLSSKGPIFYVQERIGLNGEKFELYKFRTMIYNAEENGPVWSGNNDPRITKVGRFLRALGLDEIPQFINVLKNEMSVIGPRPERPYFVDKLKKVIPNYLHRLKVKPGITGLAQIKRGSDFCEDDVRRKSKYDCIYVNRISMLLDVYIIIKTFSLLLCKLILICKL